MIPDQDMGIAPPANDAGGDDSNAPAIQITGTDGKPVAMPYPKIDYKPQKATDTWSDDMTRSPWMALMAAGADTMATGNLGRGIGTGLKTYEGIRSKAQEREQKGLELDNQGAYQQAEVHEGVDRLFNEANDAAVRQKHEDDVLAESHRHNLADEHDASARLGIEGANSGTERDRLLWDEKNNPHGGEGVNWVNDQGVAGVHYPDGTFIPKAHIENRSTDPSDTAGTLWHEYQTETSVYDPQNPNANSYGYVPKKGAPNYTDWLKTHKADEVTPNPGAAASPAPAKPQQPQQGANTPPPTPPRPQGVPDASIRANAQLAIKANPQARAAILARLKAWKVPATGL